MGYYVEIQYSDWHLPKKHLDEAYRRMCELNVTHHSVKRGGSYHKDEDGTAHENKWFSWMLPNYPDVCKNAKDILCELGFDIGEDENGLEILGYDNKTGQEELFLESVSDLVVSLLPERLPYIVWSGEDGGSWKEIYGEKPVQRFDGVVSYPGEENLSKNASS